MGAWDVGTFDNDAACDWAASLEEFNDLDLVKDAIDAVLELDDEYVDADLGCEALAACEVVARLKGNWGVRNSYTEAVDAWVEAHAVKPSDDLVKDAARAIDRILAPESELPELWDEGGDEWRASVADLRTRVVG